MKILLPVVLFFCFGAKGQTQSLEGEWEGYFTQTLNRNKTFIKISFIKKEDSIYYAYSTTAIKTDGRIDTVVCLLEGSFYRANQVVLLKEKTVLKSSLKWEFKTCLQMMNLRLIKRKDTMELRGNWDADNCGEGRIYVYKVLK